tara:strand:+ start:1441 stop:1641 length:201 start_codon:yes stop_codon:yes gene_type:complete
MKTKILIIIICIISSPAHAYIDPGSGSIIAQALMFIIASVGIFYGYIKNKIKSIYNKLFKKKDKSL